MDSFSGKLAVVTGGGSGMGRELVGQLAAQGCSVAACDLNTDAVAETAALAREGVPPGVRVSGHACDVSEEAQVLRFRDELLAEVRVAVVMPGHVGTDIVANSMRAHGILPESGPMTDAQQERRAELIRRGALTEGASADEMRQMLEKMNADFRDGAPLSADGAATIILDGVRSGAWRILVGQDAAALDAAVRANPEDAYDYPALASMAGNPGAAPEGG
jgi:NAD(P)-dependent dehydrogenase (short-subunit alcohol dehydrogenase family)